MMKMNVEFQNTGKRFKYLIKPAKLNYYSQKLKVESKQDKEKNTNQFDNENWGLGLMSKERITNLYS